CGDRRGGAPRRAQHRHAAAPRPRVVGNPGLLFRVAPVDAEVLAEAVELTRARTPFALATVVWRRAPSSGHIGSKGVVLSDGTVRGWLGGACAEPTVVREALASLADGAARRLWLGASGG